MSDDRLDRIEAKIDALATSQTELRTDVMSLQTGQTDLRRHIGVLHEEVLDRIKGLADHAIPGQRGGPILRAQDQGA